MKIKILELYGDGASATGARYLASITDGQITVESEGNWYFDAVPLGNLTEDAVAQIITQATTKDGVNGIQTRLQEQLSAQTKAIRLPWLPETFTVSV